MRMARALAVGVLLLFQQHRHLGTIRRDVKINAVARPGAQDVVNNLGAGVGQLAEQFLLFRAFAQNGLGQLLGGRRYRPARREAA